MSKSLDNFRKQLKHAGIELKPLQDKGILREAVGVTIGRPEVVVRPGNLDQLKAILPAARAQGIDLWQAWNQSGNALQIGSGKGPAVLLDLSDLNQILSVDTQSAYALVEPGVSHAQLSDYLKKKGLKFWVESGRNAEDSIAGGIWNRSFGYTGYGDRLMMQCGMELMLSDGSLVRTGMGAMPGENTWQLFKYGYGPYTDGVFTQTSYAVITKIGFWISPVPPAYRPFAMRVDDDNALVHAMDAVRNLRISMVVPNTIVVTDQASEQGLIGESGGAEWNVFGALYGAPNNVEATWKAISGMASQIDGVKIEALDSATGSKGDAARAALMRGEPLGGAAAKARGEKAQLCMVFAAPIEGEVSADFVRRSRKAAAGTGCEVFIEQGCSWRALLLETRIVFEDGKDKAALDLSRRLIEMWASEGLGVVRSSPALESAVASTYGDPGFRKLKSELDSVLA